MTEGTFTGAEAAMGEPCADCHEGMEVYLNSFHSRIWQGENGCESCHGSVDQHMNDPSPQTIISFGEKSGRTAEELSGQCLNCHADSANLIYWDMGQHGNNDVPCTSCHSIHKTRSTVRQPKVCFECHKSTKVDANKQSHHPIIEGKVKCGDCHNPHGTLSHAMIRAENNNQLCYQCHPDKRGPFIYEHPPVEENCAVCHTPHGSRHNKLMTEKVPNLCQDCHDWSRHPGTAYDATAGFTGSSPSNRYYARSCLNCHGAIHGSAHFENHALTR